MALGAGYVPNIESKTSTYIRKIFFAYLVLMCQKNKWRVTYIGALVEDNFHV